MAANRPACAQPTDRLPSGRPASLRGGRKERQLMKKVPATTLLSRALPVLAAVVCLSVGAPRAHAGSLLFWDFENVTSSGSISTATGTSLAVGISGTASQTGGGPAEQLADAGDDGGYWLLTR